VNVALHHSEAFNSKTEEADSKSMRERGQMFLRGSFLIDQSDVDRLVAELDKIGAAHPDINRDIFVPAVRVSEIQLLR